MEIEMETETAYLLRRRSSAERTLRKYFPLDLEDFDGVLEVVGSEGYFQKFLLYVLMCPMAVAEPFFSMNMFFMLYLPDHWCHVPGRTNETLEEWRQSTVPRHEDTGLLSQCRMYESFDSNATVPCRYGWDYDQTFYYATIPSTFDWVCANSDYGPRTFTTSTIGNCIGTILLGHAADKVGRKPIIFLSLMITIVFGGLSLFLPDYYTWYLVAIFFSGLAYPSLTTSLALIASETCSKNYRSWVFTLLCFCRVAGNVLFPLLAWASGHWFTIGIISYVPAVVILLFFWPFLPESPRWLLANGAFHEAHDVLRKIAKQNGRHVNSSELAEDLTRIRQRMVTKEETQKGGNAPWMLFATKRLAKHTILLAITWALVGLNFYGLNLHTLNMSGNPFLNYVFLVGLTELPAGWFYGFVVDRTGRRWTQCALLLLAAIVCFTAFFVTSSYGIDSPAIIVLGICAKFLVVLCDLITDLQGCELFPTSLRATGFSFASTMSAFVQILAPYIIFMTDSTNALPFLILSVMSLLASFTAAFLPETLGRNLPETIEEANFIGIQDPFWSFLPS